MIDDRTAEHVPGCNMAFYAWALRQVNGFDPQFRKAGDDVDVIWRLQNLDYTHRLRPRRPGLALPPQHRQRLPQASSAATARPRRCSSTSTPTASTRWAPATGAGGSTAATASACASGRT